MTPTRFALGLAALSLAVSGNIACRSAGLSNQIETLMNEQTEQWNRGSIDGFMRYYVHSDELTFSSGDELRRGWNETIARYKLRYPDRKAMGTLSFSDLESTALGDRHALTLGRWHLDRDAGSIGGSFSLVWRRAGRDWLILHDHTTQSRPGP